MPPRRTNHLDYYTPPPAHRPPVLTLARWGLYSGILSILSSITESGPTINGASTTAVRWSAPGLQGFICVVALWINWQALKRIRRSPTHHSGKPLAIIGASLAGLKLLLLFALY